MELNENDVGKCMCFSYEVTRRTAEYYGKRNKYATTEKLIFDHFIGKLAEVFVYNNFTEFGYRCSYPSFKTEYEKNDIADMVVLKDGKEIKIHCKVVRCDSPVTNSWLIETKEIPALDENDYFAFCVFNSPTDIEIKRLVCSIGIPWKRPRHKSLVTKSAAYLEDLPSRKSLISDSKSLM